MKLDIIIVTYNSEKWLKNCIGSIESQKGIDLKDINLYFVDNISKDATIKELNKFKLNSKIGGFKIIDAKKNLGFGISNNLGFLEGNSEYVFFLNPDTSLEEDTLFELFKDIEDSNKNFSMWELRQKPYEHPKWYNILTGETSWSSGACFVIKREVFEKIGGFDKNIFMYAEDVDLSWKVRLYGHKIKYVPKAAIYHYCYKTAGEVKPTQYFNSIINNLNLRFKYGTLGDIKRWFIRFRQIISNPGPFRNSRSGLLKKFISNLFILPKFIFWRWNKENNKMLKNFKPIFLDFDYEGTRYGAFLPFREIKEKPLVSIIVRTCGRPNVLRETLISLRNQTYKNFEVVVVEDGKNISEKMLKEEFKDLNIIYIASEEKVGRCINGNKGLEIANGKYLNFLDDDDLFYADHIETLVNELEFSGKYKIAYSVSYETKIDVKKKEPEYIYEEVEKALVHNKPFSRITLLTRNAFPIQSVMFAKEIYIKYGGFDLSLDNLEDWELWARYAAENTFLYVPKVTSVYRVPSKIEKYSKRQEEIDSYYKIARSKILSRNVIIKPEDLLEEVKYI
jgi:GT2 family glycosyltransferase